jgi:hypothetical protein
MPATATGSFYEVQGLAPCPAARHGRRGDKCSVPDEGEWHGIFFVDTRSEAEEALAHVMESDSPLYANFEDFRLAVPEERALKRRRAAEGYVWDRRAPRRVEATSRTTIPTQKGKRRKRAA